MYNELKHELINLETVWNCKARYLIISYQDKIQLDKEYMLENKNEGAVCLTQFLNVPILIARRTMYPYFVMAEPIEIVQEIREKGPFG